MWESQVVRKAVDRFGWAEGVEWLVAGEDEKGIFERWSWQERSEVY
jgi:hypothetical protein